MASKRIGFFAGPTADPKNMLEFIQRFQANQKTIGVGVLTQCHVPCPFCGAPDFLVHPVHKLKDHWEKGAVCGNCFRGAKGVIEHKNGKPHLVVYQTVGAPPPAWMPDKPPRLVTHEGKHVKQNSDESANAPSCGLPSEPQPKSQPSLAEGPREEIPAVEETHH